MTGALFLKFPARCSVCGDQLPAGGVVVLHRRPTSFGCLSHYPDGPALRHCVREAQQRRQRYIDSMKKNGNDCPPWFTDFDQAPLMEEEFPVRIAHDWEGLEEGFDGSESTEQEEDF